MRYVAAPVLGPVTSELLDSFAALPADPHLRGDHVFRFRAFGEAGVEGGRVRWDEEPADFFQSGELNEYAGGTPRRFATLPEPARAYAENLVASDAVRALAPDTYRLGCHQIRVTAVDDHPGLPAPEGFHQDGFDLVAVACVAAENVSGGISLLRETREDGDVIMERVMPPGEVLLFVDPEVVHYVSPITPKLPGHPAYRDVTVLTFAFGRTG